MYKEEGKKSLYSDDTGYKEDLHRLLDEIPLPTEESVSSLNTSPLDTRSYCNTQRDTVSDSHTTENNLTPISSRTGGNNDTSLSHTDPSASGALIHLSHYTHFHHSHSRYDEDRKDDKSIDHASSINQRIKFNLRDLDGTQDQFQESRGERERERLGERERTRGKLMRDSVSPQYAEKKTIMFSHMDESDVSNVSNISQISNMGSLTPSQMSKMVKWGATHTAPQQDQSMFPNVHASTAEFHNNNTASQNDESSPYVLKQVKNLECEESLSFTPSPASQGSFFL